ncbi:MAG TPA: hypothetical protein V6C65_16800 [Allocoleopsis sp.]
MFGLVKRNESAESQVGRESVDAELASAARTTVASTSPIINGYRKYSESEVNNLDKQLKERQEFSKRFHKVLSIVAKWQETDVKDTAALTQFRTQTAKNAYTKLGLVAKGRAQQEVIQAGFAARMETLKASTSSRISELQQRKAEAIKQLGGVKRNG